MKRKREIERKLLKNRKESKKYLNKQKRNNIVRLQKSHQTTMNNDERIE